MTESPDSIKDIVNIGEIQTPKDARKILGDGSFGGMYEADDSIMQGLFDTVVDEFVALIERR